GNAFEGLGSDDGEANALVPRRPEIGLRGECGEHVLAGVLAGAADLRTDTAVLVVVGVPLALRCTEATRLEARLDHRACQLRHELRLPAHDPACRDAHVAAVLAERDAAQQRQDIWFGSGRIAAGGAALRAVEARLDARDQRSRFDLNRLWIRLQHLTSVAHD